MFERFADSARRVVVLAQEESRALGHGWIGPEHLLLGLIREDVGPGGTVLRSFGLAVDGVRSDAAAIGQGEPRPTEHIPFLLSARRVLENAQRAAGQPDHGYVGSGHLLLGLLEEEDEEDGFAAEVFVRAGIDVADIRGRVRIAIARASEVQTARATSPPQQAIRKANEKARVIAMRLGLAIRAKEAAIAAGDPAGVVAAQREEEALLAERAELLATLTRGEEAPGPLGSGHRSP